MKSVLLASLVALSLSACRGSSDPGEQTPDGGDPITGATTIYDVQMGKIADGNTVSLAGVVVTAVDTYGARKGGFYVQELAGGPYSGVFVFSASGPDAETIQPGDLVDLEGGVVDEFAIMDEMHQRRLTEITGPLVTRTGTAAIPEPAVVDPVELSTADDDLNDTTEDNAAEKWEGVLVRIEKVAVVGSLGAVSTSATADPTLKEMRVTGPLRVQTALADLDSAAVGNCYASMTGVIDYFFDYKLLPRSADDLVPGSGCPVEEAAQCDNDIDDDHDGYKDCADFLCLQASASCSAPTNIVAIQTGAVPAGSQVSLTGSIVTAVKGRHLWVEEAAGGPNSGVHVYALTAPSEIAVGDIVDVKGTVKENFDLTEIANALVTKTGSGSVPAPEAFVDYASLTAASTAEAFEGVLVSVSNVKVLTRPDSYGEFTVGQAVPLQVDDLLFKAEAAVDSCVNITGVLHYSFSAYKLLPRGAADVTVGTGCP